MDNFHIDITSIGEAALVQAMALAFTRGYSGSPTRAVAYKVDPKRGLAFYWSATYLDEGAQLIPFKLDAAGAADFASRWLREQDCNDWDTPPSHDGHNKAGWRLFNDAWGRPEGFGDYSFIAVRPHWCCYSK